MKLKKQKLLLKMNRKKNELPKTKKISKEIKLKMAKLKSKRNLD